LSSGQWNDSLPRADYEHMLYTQPKLLGFALWKKSQKSGGVTRQEKAELNYEAYETTLRCLEAKEIDHKKLLDIKNNLLYYCVGFVFYCSDDDVRVSRVSSEIPNLLDALLAESGGVDQLSIEDLDTVFRAYAFLKDERAKAVATILIQRCLRKDAALISSLRMSIAEVAQEFLDKGTIVAM